MTLHSVTSFMNVARVARTHGKKGEVVVVPLDGLPSCLYEGMRVCLTPPDLHDDRFRTVEHVGSGQMPLVRFSGVSDISAAEKLVGKMILVSRDDAPQAAQAQAVLDCVGAAMVDDVHGPVGIVHEIMHLPANDVWVVQGSRFGEVLVPVIPDVILSLPHDDEPLMVHLMPGILPVSE